MQEANASTYASTTTMRSREAPIFLFGLLIVILAKFGDGKVFFDYSSKIARVDTVREETENAKRSEGEANHQKQAEALAGKLFDDILHTLAESQGVTVKTTDVLSLSIQVPHNSTSVDDGVYNPDEEMLEQAYYVGAI